MSRPLISAGRGPIVEKVRTISSLRAGVEMRGLDPRAATPQQQPTSTAAAPAPLTVDLHGTSGPIRCAVVAWGPREVGLRPLGAPVDWLPHLTPGAHLVATWLAGTDQALEGVLSVSGRADGGVVRGVLGDVAARHERSGRRHLVQWPVQVAIMEGGRPCVVVARTVDVSAVGLGIRATDLVAGTTVVVALGLPCGHTLLGLAAVAQVDPHAQRAGLGFVALSEHDGSRLVQALFAVERERARHA